MPDKQSTVGRGMFIGNARALPPDALPQIRIDRDEEIERCMHALFERDDNVLVHGERGLGKTFLVRLLQQEIRCRFPDAVSGYMDAQAALLLHPQDSVAAFPRAVLLELCKTIWVEIFGEEYSTLRGAVDESGHRMGIKGKGAQKVIDTYRLLMSSDRRVTDTQERSVGAVAVLKGEAKEGAQRQWSPTPVLPFEFFEFVDELCRHALVPHGKRRIVIACDEANHLQEDQQREILERHLPLFAARQVQFVFVVGSTIGGQAEGVWNEFGCLLGLSGFSEQRHVTAMLNNLLPDGGPSIEDGAVAIAHELLKGHPRNTIAACAEACRLAESTGTSTIDPLLMARACGVVMERHATWLENAGRRSHHPS